MEDKLPAHVHETNFNKAAVTSVSLHYFAKVLREQIAFGSKSTVRMLVDDPLEKNETWFDDQRAYWIRRTL